MEYRNEELWNETVKKNTDFYGGGVVRFAKRWAEAMEAEMAAGKKLEDVADAACRTADTEGITGFMYGCAVSILASTWSYGEALRRWHNLETQIGTEGERANAEGGVLNPALLSIGSKK